MIYDSPYTFGKRSGLFSLTNVWLCFFRCSVQVNLLNMFDPHALFLPYLIIIPQLIFLFSSESFPKNIGHLMLRNDTVDA